MRNVSAVLELRPPYLAVCSAIGIEADKPSSVKLL
jgi:hypothetical protein